MKPTETVKPKQDKKDNKKGGKRVWGKSFRKTNQTKDHRLCRCSLLKEGVGRENSWHRK